MLRFALEMTAGSLFSLDHFTSFSPSVKQDIKCVGSFLPKCEKPVRHVTYSGVGSSRWHSNWLIWLHETNYVLTKHLF